jgi:hypothetical protein
MKKTILSLLVVLFLSTTFASAQVDGSAIGLRFNYSGAEISYLHKLQDNHRLEADLGLTSWGLSATGIYHWVWDLSQLADGFNWYAGAGATLGLSSGSFGLGAVGQVGIEYNFAIPLQLTMDYRPAIYIIPSVGGSYDGICLSVRYKF